MGYVISAGEGRLYERVKPYVFAAYEDVDVNYYVTKQVLSAAAWVLEFFDVTEEELRKEAGKEKETKSLTDFMRN